MNCLTANIVAIRLLCTSAEFYYFFEQNQIDSAKNAIALNNKCTSVHHISNVYV